MPLHVCVHINWWHKWIRTFVKELSFFTFHFLSGLSISDIGQLFQFVAVLMKIQSKNKTTTTKKSPIIHFWKNKVYYSKKQKKQSRLTINFNKIMCVSHATHSYTSSEVSVRFHFYNPLCIFFNFFWGRGIFWWQPFVSGANYWEKKRKKNISLKWKFSNLDITLSKTKHHFNYICNNHAHFGK